MERPGGQRLFHWRSKSEERDDSALVRLFSPASWIHSQRWHGVRRIFPARRWRPLYVLEEQSLPRAEIHWRRRLSASAVGRYRPWQQAERERDSRCLG